MGEFKIIFFGTPDFAVNSLNAINSKFTVDYVVTTPDKRSGRGQKIQESEIKKYAINNNISFLQPDDLKDSIFIEKIKDIKPDLMIVVAFKKLPSELISIPKFGTINLHASLLPEYRGAAPINWCIINGETKTGVTTFFINEDIDQGDILLQKDIKINDDDDFESLYLKLSNLGAELLVNTIKGVTTKKIKSFKQEKNNEYNLAPKLTSENTRIDWNLSVQKIISKIKGLSPRPGAWTMIKNGDDEIRMKILKAKEKMDYNSNKKNGNIVTENGELLIINSSGITNCVIIQLENKRKMHAKELINGFKFHKNSYVY
ncbi:MAG: methionyl-tRNA formyltransferase [Candidatus Marisimplicoccus sp.]